MQFFSQQGEDIFVFRNFINQHVKDGIYVELGNDSCYLGIEFTVTYLIKDQ